MAVTRIQAWVLSPGQDQSIGFEPGQQLIESRAVEGAVSLLDDDRVDDDQGRRFHGASLADRPGDHFRRLRLDIG